MGLYEKIEDKYYAFLDKIPWIYKIVDPIDKHFPSLILFTIIILLIVLSGVIFFLQGGVIGPSQVFLEISVMDSEGNPIGNAPVTLTLEGQSFDYVTTALGKVSGITVAPGSIATIEVSLDGYEPYPFTETFTVEQDMTKTITLTAEAVAQGITRTIKLVNEFGQPVNGYSFRLSFSCNGSADAPNDMTIYSSQFTVTEPVGCDGLSVSVFSDDFETSYSNRISSDGQKIFLTELTTENEGLILVNVSDKTDEKPLDDIKVSLYYDLSLGPIDYGYSLYGQKSFSVAPGSYYVKTYDEANIYDATQTYVRVEAGDRVNVDLLLEKLDLDEPTPSAGLIKINVLEERNGKKIKNAVVSLIDGNNEVAELQTDVNGFVEFNTGDKDKNFSVIIEHEEYLLKKVFDLKASDDTYVIYLTKFDGTNGATMNVRVIDQDAMPVKNAKVALYDQDGFLLGFREQTTDFNGFCKFTRVQNGTYKAFAFKSSISGWSDAVSFQQRLADETLLIVTMNIPSGTFRFIITDDDNVPVPLAFVTVFDATSKAVIGTLPIEDLNGVLDFETKADKKVYFKISKEGFNDVTTQTFNVIPNTVQEIPIKLSPKNVSGNIEVKFLGFYSSEFKASDLRPNGEYVARFELIVPSGKDFSEAGVHFRLGDYEFMENDPIFLKKINASSDASIKKFTRFNANNYDLSVESITEGEAKWANIVWKTPSAGVHVIEATVKVKSNASMGEKIEINYRGWAKRSSTIQRDPADEAITGNELFSKTYTEIFTVLNGKICDDQFCFEAFIEDLDENLIEQVKEQEYSAGIFQKYKLNFLILNNDVERIYDNAELRIKDKSKAVEFYSYSIEKPEGAKVSNKDFRLTQLDRILIGNFGARTTVLGELGFEAMKEKTAIIELLIVSNKKIVFSKEIVIEILAANEFNMEIEPTLLAPGTPNNLFITIRDNESGVELEGANVKITDRFKDIISIPSIVQTSKSGKALLTIPAQEPNTTLWATVEKKGYKTLTQPFAIDGNILELKPEKIGITLNAQTLQETSSLFSVKNLLNYDLKIKSFEITGDFKGFIDKEKMLNWLYSFEEISISPKEIKEFSLKTFLTEEGKAIDETKNLKGTLSIEVQRDDLSSWIFEIPLTIVIGLGGETDDPNCFSIGLHDWQTYTEGAPASIEFTIQNNCVLNGQPIELRDLEAKIEWESNNIGSFDLSVPDGFAELRQGYYKKVLSNLEKDFEESGILQFTPNGGVNGEAKAKVFIRATNLTENGKQLIEDELTVSIKVVNLIECISISKDLMEMEENGKDSFTVETKDCATSVKFSFDSDLEIYPKEVSLTQTQKSEPIEVRANRELPGQYGIKVTIERSGPSVSQNYKLLRARINPSADKCISLSRYEFDIFDNPNNAFDGYDEMEVINKCPEQTVKIKIDTKSWTDAMKKSWLPGVYALVGSALLQKGGFGRLWGTAASVVGGIIGNDCDCQKGTSCKTGYEINTSTTDKCGEGEVCCKKIETNQENICAKNGFVCYSTPCEQITPLGKFYAKDFPCPTSNQYCCAEKEDITLPSTNIPTGPINAPPLGTSASTVPYPTPATGLVAQTSATEYVAAQNPIEVLTVAQQASQTVNNLLASITSLTTMNPWGAGLLTFVGATIYNYYNQKPIYMDVLQLDLKITDYKLFEEALGIKPNPESKQVSETGKTEENISLKAGKPEQELENNKLIEFSRIIFQNKAGLVQSDIMAPFYRIFEVDGLHYNWATDYKKILPTDPKTGDYKLDPGVPATESMKQQFHLQFNSINPTERVRDEGALGNCQMGSKLGSTGPNAVPKIKLDWNWKSIEINECDESNENSIYCDATQFSIELLRKTDAIRKFVETYGPFGCPAGISDCSPYSTKYLTQFIEAAEASGTVFPAGEKEKVLSYVNFNAYLIKDGYSADFQKDFHEFAMTKEFFGVPEDLYKNASNGLGNYFKDNSLFKFEYTGAPHDPIPGPGMYKATIEIIFNDKNWKLFENNKPSAKIIVHLEKLDLPHPTSPFYYLPFDGLIGTEGSRVGYGVNYSGASIKVNEETDQLVRTTDIADSVPVAEIESIENQDFKTLNNTNRGNLLEIKRSTNTQIIFSPSYATPVIMEVNYQLKGSSPFAFYSVEVDKQPQNVGVKGLSRWSGFGVNCKDFTDMLTTRAFSESADQHGMLSQLSCARLGSDQPGWYGIEWCNANKSGSVFLQTIFFTPQKSESVLEKQAASDNLQFYSTKILGGSNRVSLQEGTKITSIEKILELVENETVCVTGLDNEARIEFWWNPKTVLSSLDAKKAELIKKCIPVN